MDMSWPIVDVRDVALAHILAFESPSAVPGRYLIYSETLHMRDVIASARARFPHLKFPGWDLSSYVGTWAMWYAVYFYSKGERDYAHKRLANHVYANSDKSKKELGIVYRSAKESLFDAYNDLIAQGKLPKQ